MLMFAPYFGTLSEENSQKNLHWWLRAKESLPRIEGARFVAFRCPIYMSHTRFVQAFDGQRDKKKVVGAIPQVTELQNYPIR
jgi:hypothetical protein